MFLIKINAEPVRIVNQKNVFRNTQFGGYYWAAANNIPDGAEIASITELEAIVADIFEDNLVDAERTPLSKVLTEWTNEHFAVPHYAISPERSIVKVGQTVNVAITGAQNETLNIDISGTLHAVVLDAAGMAMLSFIIKTPGEYIVTGDGGLASCIAAIFAA